MLEPVAVLGTIRSAFLMTEPAVASSDATNIACSIRRERDFYIINGRKWWSTGAMDPRCQVRTITESPTVVRVAPQCRDPRSFFGQRHPSQDASGSSWFTLGCHERSLQASTRRVRLPGTYKTLGSSTACSGIVDTVRSPQSRHTPWMMHGGVEFMSAARRDAE